MDWGNQKYRDRFGNEWSVRAEMKPGKRRRITFTCKEFRLVSEHDETEDPETLTLTRLKEFFCDAERVLEHGGKKWHVGFRKRTGRGGQAHGGIQTRFRSETGEVRYARGMLHFRHMPQNALRKHLVAAAPAVSAQARVRWTT